MYKNLALSTLVVLFGTSGSFGANLGGVKCTDPELIAIMEKNAKSAQIDGSPAFSYGVHTGKILSSKTLHASRSKLICGITIKLTQSGAANNLRLTYTFEQFSNGKIKATIGER